MKKETYGTMTLSYSKQGTPEEAASKLNDLNIDLNQLEKLLKQIGIEVKLHDVEVTQDDYFDGDDEDDEE